MTCEVTISERGFSGAWNVLWYIYIFPRTPLLFEGFKKYKGSRQAIKRKAWIFSVCSETPAIYDDWMQETTQRIIKLLGLLLPDLLVKKCSYQTSL